MIDHIGIASTDFERSRAFYTQTLAPLGYALLMEVTAGQTGAGAHAGFGIAPKPEFWITEGPAMQTRVHVAFRAQSRAQVDAFYRAAIAAGARGNGAPGLRSHYHPHYYGAFVLDPDGHNIEAVCHDPA